MKTKRRKILLLCMQVLLPVVPGLWTVLFRPETAALSPRMLVTWMLCLNLLFILIYWRRLGWSRSERLDTALLLVLFCTRKSGWGWEGFLAEADTGSGLKFPRWARGYVTYVIPVGMLIVFAMGYAPIIAKWAGLG